MLDPWKKSYDKPRQHIKKQRCYFAHKGPYSQNYGFSRSHVWMWGLDHKKAECQRIDAFELWCWRRPLRVPWTARRSNQWILKEIIPEYSLEGLMLKLEAASHLMWRTDSLKKILMLGKIEGRRRRGRQDEMIGRHYWLIGHEFSRLQVLVMDREGWHAAVHGVTKSRIWLNNWTELTEKIPQSNLKKNFFKDHIVESLCFKSLWVWNLCYLFHVLTLSHLASWPSLPF